MIPFWCELEQAESWFSEARAESHWEDLKNLFLVYGDAVVLFKNAPEKANLEAFQFVIDDIQSGAEPSIKNENLFTACAMLLTDQLFDFRQRQGLFEIESPKAALEYVRTTMAARFHELRVQGTGKLTNLTGALRPS